jgi:hypothetical protein
VIIDNLTDEEGRRISPRKLFLDRRALQETISRKLGGDPRDALVIMEEVRELLKNEMIW